MSARVLRRLRRLTDVLLIVGFVLAIALPLADVVVGLDPTPVLTEKRSLAPPPGAAARLAGRARHPLPGRGGAEQRDHLSRVHARRAESRPPDDAHAPARGP